MPGDLILEESDLDAPDISIAYHWNRSVGYIETTWFITSSYGGLTSRFGSTHCKEQLARVAFTDAVAGRQYDIELYNEGMDETKSAHRTLSITVLPWKGM